MKIEEEQQRVVESQVQDEGSQGQDEGGQGQDKGGKKRKRAMVVRGVWSDRKERDKWGNIIRICRIDGCSYKTGNMWNMKQHKTRKHNIGENMTKIPNDGKERDT